MVSIEMQSDEKSLWKWSTDWVQYLDADKIQLYALQFANCNRIENNDIVYIFDEVGSGKTISCGLMAMHYLNYRTKELKQCGNGRKAKALVISTNTIKKNGQFKKDWEDKFGALTHRFDIGYINNLYVDIKKAGDQHSVAGNYDLIIVDEVHTFVNRETEAYKNLKALQANKVIFLSATPVKTDFEKDLQTYAELGAALTSGATEALPEKMQMEKEKLLKAFRRDKKNAICADFDETNAVSRYFKDTIKCFAQKDQTEYTKNTGKRELAEIWEPDYGDDFRTGRKYEKQDTILDVVTRISEIMQKQQESDRKTSHRFIIFIHYIHEIMIFENLLSQNHFVPFHIKENDNDIWTYKSITGENSNELADIDKNHAPTVLLVTDKIAENGINLPWYDYVVNYHISAFPSVLEQRYGRIDRINSDYEHIHMVYVLERRRESTEFNFFEACYRSRKLLDFGIPARNVLFSKGFYEKIFEKKNLEKFKQIIAYYEGLRRIDLLADFVNIVCQSDQWDSEGNFIGNDIGDERWTADHLKLLELLAFDTKTEEENLDQLRRVFFDVDNKFFIREKVIATIEIAIDKKIEDICCLEKMAHKVAKKMDEENVPRSETDDILISKEDGSYDILSAVDCVTGIKENAHFLAYKKEFDKIVKPAMDYAQLLKRYRYPISHAIERLFLEDAPDQENNFTIIFATHLKPREKSRKQLIEKLSGDEIFINEVGADSSEELKSQLWELYESDRFEYLLQRTPFWEDICERFRRELVYCATNYERFDFDPFWEAFSFVMQTIRNSQDNRFSKEMTVFVERASGAGNVFYLEVKSQDGKCIIEASPFYKLAYLNLMMAKKWIYSFPKWKEYSAWKWLFRTETDKLRSYLEKRDYYLRVQNKESMTKTDVKYEEWTEYMIRSGNIFTN